MVVMLTMGNATARSRGADRSRLEAANSAEGVPIVSLCQVLRNLEVGKSQCFHELCESNGVLRLCLPHGRPSTAWLPGPLTFIHILGVP